MSHIEILKKYWIVANKRLWQNFLINDDILSKIANHINITWKDVIEVWPWYWALTEKLLYNNPKELLLVELDDKMVNILEKRIINQELKTNSIFNILNKDILEFHPDFKDYFVIANIPYYITSPILTHFFFEVKNKPSDMIILMQKDVWDKILLKNWNKRSVLSLYCEYACSEIKEIMKVWPNNFIPAPKVESSVLHFKLKESINIEESTLFLRIIKAWFSERRKKLISNLQKNWLYAKNSLKDSFILLWLDENIRAEELNVSNWLKLVDLLK